MFYCELNKKREWIMKIVFSFIRCLFFNCDIYFKLSYCYWYWFSYFMKGSLEWFGVEVSFFKEKNRLC